MNASLIGLCCSTRGTSIACPTHTEFVEFGNSTSTPLLNVRPQRGESQVRISLPRYLIPFRKQSVFFSCRLLDGWNTAIALPGHQRLTLTPQKCRRRRERSLRARLSALPSPMLSPASTPFTCTREYVATAAQFTEGGGMLMWVCKVTWRVLQEESSPCHQGDQVLCNQIYGRTSPKHHFCWEMV